MTHQTAQPLTNRIILVRVLRYGMLLILSTTGLILSNAASAAITPSTIRGLQGKCLDIAGAKKNNSARLVLYSCHGYQHQTWALNNKGQIRSSLHGKCLDVHRSNKVDVSVYTCHSGINQQWRQGSNGSLVSQYTGKCLDVWGSDLSTIKTFTCHGGPNQRWRFVDNQLKNKVPSVYGAICGTNRLRGIRDDLIARNSSPYSLNPLIDLKLTHTDVGNFLTDLANFAGLSNNDKICVWQLFSTGNIKFNIRGSEEQDGERGRARHSYTVNEIGAHPLVINNDGNGAWNTAAHTVVGFDNDLRYHNPMADISLEEAKERIFAKETSLSSSVLCSLHCPNKGDIESSIRTATLQRQFKDNSEFRNFANWWKALFLPGGPCPGHIYEVDGSVEGVLPPRFIFRVVKSNSCHP